MTAKDDDYGHYVDIVSNKLINDSIYNIYYIDNIENIDNNNKNNKNNKNVYNNLKYIQKGFDDNGFEDTFDDNIKNISFSYLYSIFAYFINFV